MADYDWSKIGHEMYDWYTGGKSGTLGNTTITPNGGKISFSNPKNVLHTNWDLDIPDFGTDNTWENMGKWVWGNNTLKDFYRNQIANGSYVKTYDTWSNGSYDNRDYRAYNTPYNPTNTTTPTRTTPVTTALNNPSTSIPTNTNITPSTNTNWTRTTYDTNPSAGIQTQAGLGEGMSGANYMDMSQVSPEDFNAAVQAMMTTYPNNPYFDSISSGADNFLTNYYKDYYDQYDNEITKTGFDADAYRRAAQDQIEREAKNIANASLGRMARTGQVNSSVGQEFIGGNVNRYLGDALQNLEKEILTQQMADRGTNLQALAQKGAVLSQLSNNWMNAKENLANMWQDRQNNIMTQTNNLMKLYNELMNDSLMRDISFKDFVTNYLEADTSED